MSLMKATLTRTSNPPSTVLTDLLFIHDVGYRLRLTTGSEVVSFLTHPDVTLGRWLQQHVFSVPCTNLPCESSFNHLWSIESGRGNFSAESVRSVQAFKQNVVLRAREERLHGQTFQLSKTEAKHEAESFASYVSESYDERSVRPSRKISAELRASTPRVRGLEQLCAFRDEQLAKQSQPGRKRTLAQLQDFDSAAAAVVPVAPADPAAKRARVVSLDAPDQASKSQLQAWLRAAGLQLSGNKPELLDRVRTNIVRIRAATAAATTAPTASTDETVAQPAAPAKPAPAVAAKPPATCTRSASEDTQRTCCAAGTAVADTSAS
eukprot:TRINITY_DN7796_c0_g1_i1.p3 TRINITY_DN7796_c0_g1~~TRINITY_DN7796_c0_g1_i1.p3  ORF type:complete len:322 (+),score=50.33 TRINITY_DN7796_c0_g1_i1:2694-3659(+)